LGKPGWVCWGLISTARRNVNGWVNTDDSDSEFIMHVTQPFGTVQPGHNTVTTMVDPNPPPLLLCTRTTARKVLKQ
jgi:hypothetical protein